MVTKTPKKAKYGSKLQKTRVVNVNDDDDDDHTLKILICTDNHLGYNKSDPIRSSDSFRAFEECLQIGQRESVDLVLLGGDLFHVRRPDIATYIKTQKLFSKYCLGHRASTISFTDRGGETEDESSFSKESVINFLNPNINISMPAFIVHGNHDEPGGAEMVSPLDALSGAHLLTYFGSHRNCDNISIRPLRIHKGRTNVALYGLGNIKDERLFQSFKKQKVKLRAPKDAHNWFNLMVIHQNRYKHTQTGVNHVPEKFLGWKGSDGKSLLDFVLWAHEHESHPDLYYADGFHILQAGSTTPTSLSDAESKPKHCFLLTVKDRDFKLKAIPLKSTRPFISRVVALSKATPQIAVEDTTAILKFIISTIEESILSAIENFNEYTESSIPLPLEETFAEIRTNLMEDYVMSPQNDESIHYTFPSERNLKNSRLSRANRYKSKSKSNKNIDIGELEDFVQSTDNDTSNDTYQETKRTKTNAWQFDPNHLPLIRIKIETTGYSVPSISRIIRAYSHLVANPKEMLVTFNKKSRWADLDLHDDETGIDQDLKPKSNLSNLQSCAVDIDDSQNTNLSMTRKLNESLHTHQFSVFRQAELNSLLEDFVIQGDKNIIKKSFNSLLDDVMSTVTSRLEDLLKTRVETATSIDVVSDPAFDPEIFIDSYLQEREVSEVVVETHQIDPSRSEGSEGSNTPLAKSSTRGIFNPDMIIDDMDVDVDLPMPIPEEIEEEDCKIISKKSSLRQKRVRQTSKTTYKPMMQRSTRENHKITGMGTKKQIIIDEEEDELASEPLALGSTKSGPDLFDDSVEQLSQSSVYSFVSQHTFSKKRKSKRK